MSVPLDSADKKLLVLSGCVLVVLTIAAVFVPTGQQGASPGFPSSYSTAKEGAKAAYMLLDQLGFHVERWTQPPADLPTPPAHTVLIIAGATAPATTDEKQQLRDFVEQGGRLILTEMAGADLLDLKGIDLASTDLDAWTSFTAEQPAPLTLGAPEVSMQSDVRWVHPPANLRRYYGDSGGATVAWLPMGKGEVIWWAGDSPLTNVGITRASNLTLFLNSVGAPGQTRVLWDEYFHDVRPGLWSYVSRTPLPWALAQLLLLGAAVLLTYARRSGATRALARESRLSPLEFVQTLGSIYERRRESTGALETAYSHFRFLMTRRMGTPSTAATADLIRAVQNRPGWALPGFSETIDQIDQAIKAGSVPEPKALAWIGELHGFAARLNLDPGFVGRRAVQ
jgi:hypothetical protein